MIEGYIRSYAEEIEGERERVCVCVCLCVCEFRRFTNYKYESELM